MIPLCPALFPNTVLFKCWTLLKKMQFYVNLDIGFPISCPFNVLIDISFISLDAVLFHIKHFNNMNEERFIFKIDQYPKNNDPNLDNINTVAKHMASQLVV